MLATLKSININGENLCTSKETADNLIVSVIINSMECFFLHNQILPLINTQNSQGDSLHNGKEQNQKFSSGNTTIIIRKITTKHCILFSYVTHEAEADKSELSHLQSKQEFLSLLKIANCSAMAVTSRYSLVQQLQYQ